jgi:DNA polymerase-3 subunit alpha
MKELCKRIIPDCMDDITAINALYRPGPMKSGMHEEFILRKHGTNKAQYLFPELEPVLKDTLGIIIYQEQVMNISRIVAGYSLGQADMLRRAMGKKKADEMEKHQTIFCEGAKKNGYDEKKAAELFHLMANFAEYGFNKSHAVAYAYIAYHTAYLKKYYPSAFFAALLGSEMGNADKITKIIQDVNEHQIKVLPPDINESLWLFNVVGNNIRFGMGAIKNVGENAVGLLIAERVKDGDFKSFLDFCERVDLRLCNKRVLESLIQVGAFDNCDKNNRKTLLHNLEKIVAYAQKRQEDKNSSQASFFDLADSLIEEETVQIDEVPDFDMKEKLSIEKNLMGIYISGHPLHKYRGVIEQLASMGIADVHEVKGDSKREMVLVGMISELKVLMTKKGDKMAFAMLEGLDGKIECVIFPRTYSEFEPLLGTDEPLLISGAVNLAENPRKFFPTKITKLESQADTSIKNITIEMREENLNPYTFQNLKRLTLDYRGSVPVIITIENALGKVDFDLGEEYLVNPTAQFSAKVNELIGTNAVHYIMTN